MRSVAVVAIAALTACSFVMRTGRFEPPHEPFCHRWVHPIADTLVAGAAATLAVAVLAERNHDNDPGLDPGGRTDYSGFAIAFLAGVSALYTVAAVAGYRRSLRCAEEYRAYERWKREHPERR